MNSILYHGLHKNIKQHNHVTLKTVVMTAENSVLHYRNKQLFKTY